MFWDKKIETLKPDELATLQLKRLKNTLVRYSTLRFTGIFSLMPVLNPHQSKHWRISLKSLLPKNRISGGVIHSVSLPSP